MMNIKKLGIRELVMLVSPLILGVSIYVFLSGFVKEKISEIWSDYFEYRPQITEIGFRKEQKEYRIDLSLISSLIFVKPFSVPQQVQQREKPEEPPPQYKISFIYIGKNRYAIIDKKLFKEGDRISPDEKIVRITKDGILLNGKWGERWIKFLR